MSSESDKEFLRFLSGIPKENDDEKSKKSQNWDNKYFDSTNSEKFIKILFIVVESLLFIIQNAVLFFLIFAILCFIFFSQDQANGGKIFLNSIYPQDESKFPFVFVDKNKEIYDQEYITTINVNKESSDRNQDIFTKVSLKTENGNLNVNESMQMIGQAEENDVQDMNLFAMMFNKACSDTNYFNFGVLQMVSFIQLFGVISLNSMISNIHNIIAKMLVTQYKTSESNLASKSNVLGVLFATVFSIFIFFLFKTSHSDFASLYNTTFNIKKEEEFKISNYAHTFINLLSGIISPFVSLFKYLFFILYPAFNLIAGYNIYHVLSKGSFMIFVIATLFIVCCISNIVLWLLTTFDIIKKIVNNSSNGSDGSDDTDDSDDLDDAIDSDDANKNNNGFNKTTSLINNWYLKFAQNIISVIKNIDKYTKSIMKYITNVFESSGKGKLKALDLLLSMFSLLICIFVLPFLLLPLSVLMFYSVFTLLPVMICFYVTVKAVFTLISQSVNLLIDNENSNMASIKSKMFLPVMFAFMFIALLYVVSNNTFEEQFSDNMIDMIRLSVRKLLIAFVIIIMGMGYYRSNKTSNYQFLSNINDDNN